MPDKFQELAAAFKHTDNEAAMCTMLHIKYKWTIEEINKLLKDAKEIRDQADSRLAR